MNSTNGSLSQEDIYEFTRNGIPLLVYLIILCIVGTVGNLHVIIVYSFRYKASIYRTFILCLGAVDFLACLFCIPSVLYLIRHPYTVQSSAFCKTSRAAVYFVGASSLALLDVIALERYRKVCQATRTQFTLRTARIVCACVIAFVFVVVVIPVSVIYGINRKETRHEFLVGYECTVLDKFKNSSFSKIYRGVIFLIFVLLLAVCVVLYVLVGRKLYTHQNRRRKSSGEQNSVSGCCMCIARLHDPNVSTESHGYNVSESVSQEAETSDCGKDINVHNSTETTDHKDIIMINYFQNTNDNMQSSKVLTDNANDNQRESCPCVSKGVHDEFASDIHVAVRIKKDKTSLDFTKPTNTKISNMQKNKKIGRSRNITVIFLVVSVISFGGYLPYLVFTLVRNVNWQLYETFVNSCAALDLFIKWMLFLNNAINPLVYGFMDKKFRKELSSLYKQAKTWLCSLHKHN